jgi:hypothetical protein
MHPVHIENTMQPGRYGRTEQGGMTMDNDALTAAVMEASFEEDGKRKLACPEAFKLAATLDVELLDIARICNRAGIRICQCQLGCFA